MHASEFVYMHVQILHIKWACACMGTLYRPEEKKIMWIICQGDELCQFILRAKTHKKCKKCAKNIGWQKNACACAYMHVAYVECICRCSQRPYGPVEKNRSQIQGQEAEL